MPLSLKLFLYIYAHIHIQCSYWNIICISLNDIDFAINFYTKYHLGSNSNSYLLELHFTIDKLLSATSCKYFILIRRFRSFPTFDVMQPTNQPWSISVAIYSPTNTKTASESRTDDIILPLRIFFIAYGTLHSLQLFYTLTEVVF